MDKDLCMHGEVMIGKDVVTFHGHTRAELLDELDRSLDEYDDMLKDNDDA